MKQSKVSTNDEIERWQTIVRHATLKATPMVRHATIEETPLEEGVRVIVTKEGSQKHKTGRVVDTEWSGQIKISMDDVDEDGKRPIESYAAEELMVFLPAAELPSQRWRLSALIHTQNARMGRSNL